jgi:hypothetical protein
MKPDPVALVLVRTATRLLPAGEVRRRYRWELYADLHYLERPHQLAYASGVFSTAWQLRRELSQEIDPMSDTTKTATIPLLCRLNLRHHWHWESTDDGRRYRRCRTCGKDDNHMGNGPADWIATG